MHCTSGVEARPVEDWSDGGEGDRGALSVVGIVSLWVASGVAGAEEESDAEVVVGSESASN